MHSATLLLIDDHPLFRRGLAELLSESGEFTVVGQASSGRIRRANRAWRLLMGDSGLGEELAACLYQEDLPGWRAVLRQARQGDGARQCLRFIDAHGRLRWFDVQLDGLPGLIYRGRNNRQWTMEFVSAGCLQLTGYPAQYLTDTYEHSYSTLILEEYAEYVWAGVQQALLRREPYELTYRIRCADGRIKNVWEKGVGIYADTGEVLGIEGAIFEVGAGSPGEGPGSA